MGEFDGKVTGFCRILFLRDGVEDALGLRESFDTACLREAGFVKESGERAVRSRVGESLGKRKQLRLSEWWDFNGGAHSFEIAASFPSVDCSRVSA